MTLFDPHTHTIASGHVSKNTITEMARHAAGLNMPMLGITDHGPATPGSAKSSYFKALKSADRNRFGIKLLFGCETNILDYRGKLDLDTETLAGLDYAIASLHIQNITPGTVDENTTAYVLAMKNPNIRIIGHPDDVKYPVSYETLVMAAKKHQVLLELNNSSLSPAGYRGNTKVNDCTILKLCKQHQQPIILSSDSHGKDGIGDFSYALQLIYEMNFPRKLIMNYRPDQFLDFIKIKK